MALLFRGYFATAYHGNFMRRDDGTPTNGVYQFLKYFMDGITTFQPSHVICCWDMGSKTFRTEQFPEYKANRAEPPVELVPQFDLVKEVVTHFEIPNIGIENYEADDVIGSIASQFHQDHEVIIQTGDHDMLQLVKENIEVAIMKKGIGNYEVYTDDNFNDKFGLFPHQVIEYKAMVGDSADNYPGIKGIGDKTAKKLLLEYKNMQNIIDNIEQLSKGIQTKIKNDQEKFPLFKTLATIHCDLDCFVDINAAELSFDDLVVQQKLLENGIKFKF